MLDVTIGRQLNFPGIDKVNQIYAAYPYIDVLYSADVQARWNRAKNYVGHSMLDFEPTTAFPVGHIYHREFDPKYTGIDHIQMAHAEWAYALNLIRDDAKANGAKVGWYDMNVLMYRRNGDIINDYASWQDDMATITYLEATGGETLIDILKDLNGYIYWTAYTVGAWNNASLGHLQTTMIQRVAETLTELDIPNVPLIKYRSQTEENPYDPLLKSVVKLVDSYYNGNFGVWGFPYEHSRTALPYFIELPRNPRANTTKVQQFHRTLTQNEVAAGDSRAIQPGRCVDADGTDDVVLLQNDLNMDNESSWAVAMWINPDTTSGIKGLIGRQNQWALTSSNTLQLSIRNETGGNVSGVGGSLETGRWQSVILNVDNNQYNVYLDGVNVISQNTSGLSTGLNNSDTILHCSGLASPFDGRAFNVMVWKESLDSADIARYIKHEYTSLPSTYRWYKLDESQGNLCYDSSAYGAHKYYTNTQSGFFSTGNLIFSFQNEYGYSNKTNVLPQSENLNQSPWSSGSVNVIQDGTLGADGLGQAWKLTQTTTGTDNHTATNLGLPAASYTLDVYLKNASGNDACVLGIYSGGFFTVIPSILEGPGTVSGTTAVTVDGLSSSEWTKVRLSMTGSQGPTTIFFYPSPFSDQTSGNAIYVYKPHLYPESVAPSYVRTYATGYYAPIPRNESNTSLDAVGESLEYNGQVPYNAKLVRSHCGYFGGGANSVVGCGRHTLDINPSELTLEYHCRSTQTGSLKYVLYLYNGVDTYLFAHLGTPANTMAFYDGTWRSLGATPNDGNVHKVKWQISGNGVYTYVDDVFRASSVITNKSFGTGTWITVGGNYDGFGIVNYEGELWNLKLTSSGLTQLHLPFSDGSGSTVHDVSDFQRHGTLTGYTSPLFWSRGQDNYHHNAIYGFNYSGGVKVPARTGSSVDALGNALLIEAGEYLRSGLETQLSFNSGVNSPFANSVSDGMGLYLSNSGYARTPYAFDVNSNKLSFRASINMEGVTGVWTSSTAYKNPLLSQQNGRCLFGIINSGYYTNLPYTEINGYFQNLLSFVDLDTEVFDAPFANGDWRDIDVIIDGNTLTAYIDSQEITGITVTSNNNTGYFILGLHSGNAFGGNVTNVTIRKDDVVQGIYPLYKNGLDYNGENHLYLNKPSFSTRLTTGYSYGSTLPFNLYLTSGNSIEYNFEIYDAVSSNFYATGVKQLTIPNKKPGMVYDFGSTSLTTIIGGADSGNFSVVGGKLFFNLKANYLSPEDANLDNVYEVNITNNNDDGTFDYNVRVNPFMPARVSNHAKVRYGGTISPVVVTGVTLGTGIVGNYNDRFDDVGYYE